MTQMNKKKTFLWMTIISLGIFAIVIAIIIVTIDNLEDKPQYEFYVDWDAWEKAKRDCNQPVLDNIKNSSTTCNPNKENECELLKLQYESILWKSRWCSDNVKIKDYEGVREIDTT